MKQNKTNKGKEREEKKKKRTKEKYVWRSHCDSLADGECSRLYLPHDDGHASCVAVLVDDGDAEWEVCATVLQRDAVECFEKRRSGVPRDVLGRLLFDVLAGDAGDGHEDGLFVAVLAQERGQLLHDEIVALLRVAHRRVVDFVDDDDETLDADSVCELHVLTRLTASLKPRLELPTTCRDDLESTEEEAQLM